ncbi:hypothetical protein QR46_0981 [Giardia duodenalis assemblage B]|uniref:Uncharacterized protein n=1 Tax=Giardia duodenalis assemblage B TaxID=1394984 RepID=A0A132NY75_GIAIN|nr:hypothetical protein QR46_0981 [Giardia intestinalis assemblage B]
MQTGLSQSSRVRFAEQHNDEIEECRGERLAEQSDVSRGTESESIAATFRVAAGKDNEALTDEKTEKSENSAYGKLLRALCDNTPLSESGHSAIDRDCVSSLINGIIPDIEGMATVRTLDEFLSQFSIIGDATKKVVALASEMASKQVLIPPSSLELLHNMNVNYGENKVYVKPSNLVENSAINQSISVLNKSGLMAPKSSSAKGDHVPKVNFLVSTDLSCYTKILADLVSKYGSQTGYKPILPPRMKAEAVVEMAVMIEKLIPREAMGMTLLVTDVEKMFSTLRILPRYIKQTDVAPLFKKAVAVQQKILLGYPIYAPESKMFALYKAQNISEDGARMRTAMNVTRICYIGFVYLLYYLAEDIFNRTHKLSNRADMLQGQLSAPGTYDVHEAAEELMSKQVRDKRKAMALQSNAPDAHEGVSSFSQSNNSELYRSSRCDVEDIEHPYERFRTPDNIVELEVFKPAAYLWRCIYIFASLLDREFSSPDIGFGLAIPRPRLTPNLREYPECIRMMTRHVPIIKKAFSNYCLNSPILSCQGLLQLLKCAKINHIITYKFAFEVVMRNYSKVDKETFIPGLTIEEFLVALFVCANYAYSKEPIVQTLQTPEMRVEHLILQLSGKK